ncbi:hypothetical protein GMRT_13316 [Giardia muris]|uniref:NECAP PHear domain-containing protein n=1 Tax=Giardia muris TaxID=5742 RepID=A0A4Z1T176_GIAMU|nr:hypothetical protein GMRT_13316 [Giardia muris]|eukprot:TNJ26279.1 hypothetical protein GMRT_13316 [Giardia muris]
MSIEQVLATVSQAVGYRLPGTINPMNFKCADWPGEWVIFQGNLQVISKGDECFIALIAPDTGAEAARFPVEFKGVVPVVEKATDSSRYFVLIVKDPTGTKMAYIGIGFQERDGAFSFQAALADHGKYLERKANPQPQVVVNQDFSLKAGEKIKIGLGKRAGGGQPATGAKGPATFNFGPPPN